MRRGAEHSDPVVYPTTPVEPIPVDEIMRTAGPLHGTTIAENKAPRSKRRQQQFAEYRDLVFQIADFDPWIEVDGHVVCYFCRHAEHTESCTFVAVKRTARRSGLYSG